VTPAYVFEQQSFYPKYPSDVRINVPFDFTFAAGLCMHDDHRPDILFSPSCLSRFVKTHDNSLYINPGRLVMSDTAGAFAFLTIQPFNVEALGLCFSFLFVFVQHSHTCRSCIFISDFLFPLSRPSGRFRFFL
jgi:hypothetical protein